LKDKPSYQYVVCGRCGQAGGTLIKDDQGYHHQDDITCMMMKARADQVQVRNGIVRKGTQKKNSRKKASL